VFDRAPSIVKVLDSSVAKFRDRILAAQIAGEVGVSDVLVEHLRGALLDSIGNDLGFSASCDPNKIA